MFEEKEECRSSVLHYCAIGLLVLLLSTLCSDSIRPMHIEYIMDRSQVQNQHCLSFNCGQSTDRRLGHPLKTGLYSIFWLPNKSFNGCPWRCIEEAHYSIAMAYMHTGGPQLWDTLLIVNLGWRSFWYISDSGPAVRTASPKSTLITRVINALWSK